MLLLSSANLQPGVSFNAGLLEDADVLSAQAEPIVSASSASTDAQDTLAASVALTSSTIGASAALEDGPDTLATQVSVLVGSGSATDDGADVLAAAAGAIVAASSGTTNGADALAAQVAPAPAAVALSVDVLDGADVLQAAAITGTSTAGGGYDDEKPKRPRRRFVVEQDGKLRVFGSARAAVAALGQQAALEAISVPAEASAPGETQISLPAVAAYAQATGQAEDYDRALEGLHYQRLLAMFDDMRDEEDIELLMLA